MRYIIDPTPGAHWIISFARKAIIPNLTSINDTKQSNQLTAMKYKTYQVPIFSASNLFANFYAEKHRHYFTALSTAILTSCAAPPEPHISTYCISPHIEGGQAWLTENIGTVTGRAMQGEMGVIRQFEADRLQLFFPKRHDRCDERHQEISQKELIDKALAEVEDLPDGQEICSLPVGRASTDAMIKKDGARARADLLNVASNVGLAGAVVAVDGNVVTLQSMDNCELVDGFLSEFEAEYW